MSRQVVIYGLTDPRDGTIRYIGQTVNIAARYEKSAFANYVGSNQRVADWFSELRKMGMTPIAQTLDVVSEEDANARERFYIQRAANEGWPILNQMNNPAFVREKKPMPESVKRSVAFPPELYERLKQVAEIERRSVNGMLVYIMRNFVEENERGK